MFITMNSFVSIVAAVFVIIVVTMISIVIEAIVKQKNMNSKFVLVVMVLIAIATIIFVCNIDYSKSAPNEVFANEDVVDSYNAGYNAGYEKAYTSTEDWFGGLQSVTITEDNTIHLVDCNGEEWVLVSDDYQN